MIAIETLLVDLVASLPTYLADDHASVGVVELALDLPVESRIGAGALLSVSAPRGRLLTGFDLAGHGRLRVRLVREEGA